MKIKTEKESEKHLKTTDKVNDSLDNASNQFQLMINVKNGKISNYQIKRLAKVLGKHYEIEKIQKNKTRTEINNAENGIDINYLFVNLDCNEGKNMFNFKSY